MTAPSNPSDSAPPSRRLRGRPSIPLTRIVATALQVVDEEGADALTMRSLAQRLNSSTAMLYRHFASRSELVAHVIDLVFGEVNLDALDLGSKGWSQASSSIASAMLAALSRRKNVARLLMEQPPVGPNAMLQRERSIAVLLANGFPKRLAVLAYATLARYVLGHALQLGNTKSAQPPDSRLAAAFRSLDPTRFPATLSVSPFLPVPLEVEFTFGLEMILIGLDHQLAEHHSSLKHSGRARTAAKRKARRRTGRV